MFTSEQKKVDVQGCDESVLTTFVASARNTSLHASFHLIFVPFFRLGFIAQQDFERHQLDVLRLDLPESAEPRLQSANNSTQRFVPPTHRGTK